MIRQSNKELCDGIRHLLTHGFTVPEGVDRELVLAQTKEWRSQLWRGFMEAERRLRPMKDMEEYRDAAPHEQPAEEAGAVVPTKLRHDAEEEKI